MAAAPSVDMTQTTLAATAMSWQRTVMRDVNANSYVIGPRLISEPAHKWDSQIAEDRVKSIAAAELELDF